MPCAPGVFGTEVFVHATIRVVDTAAHSELAHPLLEAVDGYLLEQRHGIAVEVLPQDWVQFSEQACRIGIPTPPQILREFAEVLISGSDDLALCASFTNNWRKLSAG